MGSLWRRRQRAPGENEATDEPRPLARRFTYRYALALVAIACLATASLWSMSASLRTIDEANRELEAALTQQERVGRIVSLAKDLTADADEGTEIDSSDESLFRESVRELEITHRGLVGGNRALGLPGDPTGELEDLWFGAESRLDQEVQGFADAAARIPGLLEPSADPEERAATVSTLREAAAAGEGPVSTGLERAARLYSDKVADAVSAQQGMNQFMLFLFAVLLVLVVLVLFRPMANSIQIETTNLQEAERIHRENNERQMFHNQLAQALEGIENEDEILEAVARAMGEIIHDRPGELLLLDESQAHLRQVQTNPGVGGPNCPVDSPQACAAIRRGQTVTYETSRALNVCPKLTQREGGPCSAVCAPVMFLGRAMGVFHTTGPDLVPPDPTTVERMNVLARETGNRLGTFRATQQTKEQARTDGLTGLPNRRSLEQAARDLITVNRPFAIAMADLDHFKQLNDTYGHEAGDRALRLFARTLDDNLRPDDLAARFGGEEFVLLLPNTSLDEAKRAIDRLRVTLAGELAASGSKPFTASWGIATSEVGSTFDEMLIVADEALYAAKRAGRNRVMVAERARTKERAGAGEEATPDHDAADGVARSCPGCGEVNPADALYCLECGVPLPLETSPREDRDG